MKNNSKIYEEGNHYDTKNAKRDHIYINYYL